MINENPDLARLNYHVGEVDPVMADFAARHDLPFPSSHKASIRQGEDENQQEYFQAVCECGKEFDQKPHLSMVLFSHFQHVQEVLDQAKQDLAITAMQRHGRLQRGSDVPAGVTISVLASGEGVKAERERLTKLLQDRK